ncbi:ankyrin repeat-containing domain protein [Daldinia sp. FL1419]|nr:ankyrin repeat-containing domain protein [Daldinia sp. FL1419]
MTEPENTKIASPLGTLPEEGSLSIHMVHVTALSPEGDLHALESLFPSDLIKEKEKIVLRLEVSGLLAGDLTLVSIEQQAIHLLHELAALRERQKTPTRRIVFIAYDLGAVVVKTALSLAARRGTEFPGILADTSRVVFLGCPQRSRDIQSLELKLLDLFLNDKKTDAWFQLCTVPSIRELAKIILETTGEFINSKITLRSQIISLYANKDKPGRVSTIFDRFTATLGVPAEIPVQEEKPEKESDAQFSPLLKKILNTPWYWVRHPSWIPMEEALLSLSSPHHQSRLEPPPPPFPVVIDPVHMKWATTLDVQFLYIYGDSYREPHDIADQIFLAWQARLRDKGDYYNKDLSFTFESTDPLRNSIPPMLASFFIQSISQRNTESLTEEYNVFQDQFLFRGGWSDQSCLNILECIRHTMFGPDTLLLLHDFDECREDSRATFMKYIKQLADRSEEALRILVTSRRPKALLQELKQWQTLNADELTTKANTQEKVDGPEEAIMKTYNSSDNTAEYLTHLCPSQCQKVRIKESLGRLAPMNGASLHTALKLLQEHTGWPKNPSLGSLTRFTSLLNQVTPEDTSQHVLDRILRSHSERGGICWALAWLLYGYRPLSLSELVTIVRHRYQRKNEPVSAVETRRQLNSWFHGLVEFDCGRATIKSEIRNLLTDDTEANKYIWNEVGIAAHREMAEFCIEYITLDSTQVFLRIILQEYESRADQQRHQPAPPMISDGEEVAFYAVQALPYHLSKCPSGYSSKGLQSILENPTTPSFVLWIKAYWAMSNPFSRPREPHQSVLPILASIGRLSTEVMQNSDEASRSQCLISAAGSKKSNMVEMLLRQGKPSMDVITKALIAAIMTGDEAMALRIAELGVHPLHSSDSGSDVTCWPQQPIWAATWLDMGKLLSILLKSDVGADLQPNAEKQEMKLFRRPLQIASFLGNSSAAQVLLEHIAPGEDLFSYIEAAAGHGHAEVLRQLLKKNHPLTFSSKQMEKALFLAASEGYSEAVTILKSHSNVSNARTKPESEPEANDADTKMTPLMVACRAGFIKTIKAIWTDDSDPNSYGPGITGTPLRDATIVSANVECVRYILQKGGNPNHERIQPPLAFQLMGVDRDTDMIMSIGDVLLSCSPPMDLAGSEGEYNTTPLMRASYRKRLPLVQWLLQNRAGPHAVDNNNHGALYYALIAGDNAAVVQELLTHKPKLDIIEEETGTTLLGFAIKDPPVVKLLLEAGADPDFTSTSGLSLINYATALGMSEVVKILIDQKANINHRDKHGWSPICNAVGYIRDASLVRILADAGANLRDTVGGWSLIHFTLTDKSTDILKILLEFGKSIDLNQRNGSNETPLLAAGNDANIECLKLLVKAGANINAQNNDGDAPLSIAIWRGMPEYFNLLLSQDDIDVNIYSERWGSPLHVACRSTQVDSVSALIRHNIDVNLFKPGFFGTPLTDGMVPDTGTRSEDIAKVDQIAHILVQHGADVKIMCKGNTFYTAISAAAFAAGVSTINFLLDEGASSSLADIDSGRLPIHFAAANGIENFEAILLAYRGDMMATDRVGKNCLHWAAQFGNLQTVKFILSKVSSTTIEACVNYADSDGWTPLCWATRPFEEGWGDGLRSEKKDFVGVVRSLLENGARRDVKCQWGKGDTAETLTPLEIAQRCDAGDEIIDMLKQGLEGSGSELENNGDDTAPVQKYNIRLVCFVCLGPVFGRVYKCSDCISYIMCTKCCVNAEIFHSRQIVDDNKQHVFGLDPDRKEYQDSPPSPAPSAKDTPSQESADKANGENATPETENNDTGFNTEDIELDDDA